MKLSQRGLKYLGRLGLKYLPMVLVILALAFIDSATYTYVPMFIKYIISVLSNDGSAVNLPAFLIRWFDSGSNLITMVIYAGVGLAIFQLLRGILKFVTGCYRQFFGETIAKNIRVSMYEHIQSLPYSYHNNVDTGDLIQRCTSDNDVVRNFLSGQLGEVISVFAILIMAVYQMSQINTTLTLVSLIIVPVAFTSSLIFCIYVSRAYEKIEKSEAKLMTIMQENLAGVRVVKAFANEAFEKEKFAKQNEDYASRNLKLNRRSSIFWGFSDFTTLGQYLLLIAVAIGMMVKNPGSVSPSDIVAMMMLSSSFIWPIRGLGRIIGDMGKSVIAAGRIQEILDNKSEYENDPTNTPDMIGDIVFDNVSFKFDDTDQHLLNNLSFTINSGETVAIIGKTGSGKSTIAKMLTRLYDYQSGSITINGHELKDINKHYVRKNVGLVLQEPFLYARSVYENITITDKKLDKDIVYQAAKISAIEKDIKSFEKGYDTIVGEKGTTLSGGQKQRLAIARMLVNDKPILIFDDSLSAVDTETDVMIRNELKKREHGSTTIIITHRITTAKQADKIIVLENGQVSAVGTHETLAKREGLYKKLWDIQGRVEQEFLQILNEGGVL